MVLSNTFLSFVFIALSVVDATPRVARGTGPATLNFTKTIRNIGSTGMRLPDSDRARAKSMKNAGRLRKRDGSVPIMNNNVAYTAQVGVGEPPEYYTLLIDTGSSNTWVGANKSHPYNPTDTSIDTGDSVTVSYGSGNFSGEEWLDYITLSPGLFISNQSIGVASSSYGINNVDGILGVGPVDLTSGTVTNTYEVPTVLDNLYGQGVISQEILGVFFVPSSESNSTGKLTFGGYDSSVIIGSVNYVPLTTTSPASTYWGIDQSISYGGTTILSTTAGIVDTGTTLILIATDAFQQYQSLTGGVMDSATGLLAVSSTQYNNLKDLSFVVGNTTYNLTPNGQIWPRSLNSQIGGNSSAIYLIVSDIGSNSGSGLDFMNGYTFLERFYSVYDTTNSQVGFATTQYTDNTSN